MPRIIGQTEVTRRSKSVRTDRPTRTNRDEAMTSCPSEIQPFLAEMIDGAERRGITVYWGEKGVSLRALDQGGKVHSFFYYYPPGVYGASPFVEGYLSPILRGVSLGDELQARLLDISGFKKSGQYTFRLHLSQESVSSARQSLEVVWQVAEALQSM